METAALAMGLFPRPDRRDRPDTPDPIADDEVEPNKRFYFDSLRDENGNITRYLSVDEKDVATLVFLDREFERISWTLLHSISLSASANSSWLLERGLGHAAIRHFGVANVLCISGLPCTTSGHILCECTNAGEGSGECKLVTYQEVCERHGDCIASAAAVSQLCHTFGCSQFKADGNAEGITLELTSLSAHAASGPLSPSRLIASVGDYLNSIGLGSVCDAVALRSTFEKELIVRGIVCVDLPCAFYLFLFIFSVVAERKNSEARFPRRYYRI